MKRLLSFLPAAGAGLLAGWLISRLPAPASAADDGAPPTPKTAGPAVPNASVSQSRQAWEQMLAARSLEPIEQNRVSPPMDAGKTSHQLSSARRDLEIELARFSLSAAGINPTSLGFPLRDGDAGFAETCARLAKTEPVRALAQVEMAASSFNNRLSTDTIDKARRLIFREWLRKDPQAALAAATDAKQVKSSIQRSHRLELLMDEWTRIDPAAAAAAMPGLAQDGPDFERKRLAENILRNWHGQDPAAARAWAAGTTDPELRTALLSLTDELAATSPAAKTEVLLAAPQPDSHKLATTFAEWLVSEPGAATGKLSAIPANDKFWQNHAANVAEWWAIEARGSSTPEQFLETISTIPPGPRREVMLKGLADYGASNDIPFATRMVAEMTEGRERQEAVSGLTELWMRKDPVKTSEWLASLPAESESRNAGVARFAEGLAPDDPERAAQWAETIPDSYWQKAGVVKTVLEKWRAKDPAAAEAWQQRQ